LENDYLSVTSRPNEVAEQRTEGNRSRHYGWNRGKKGRFYFTNYKVGSLLQVSRYNLHIKGIRDR